MGSPLIVQMPEPRMRLMVLKETVSTDEAARMLNLKRRTVQSMCEDGRLRYLQPGGPHSNYRVILESVLARLEEPG